MVGGGRRLLAIAGTRPEAIKLAPLLIAAAARPRLDLRLLATGQHPALFAETLAGFGLAADLALPPLRHAPCPDAMAARYEDAILAVLGVERPDMVIVQGDTTSAYAGAGAAVRAGVPIAHVEAGLRSGDLASPWPEERNRIAIDAIAALLLAPTAAAAANLARHAGEVVVTGNTGIDALLLTAAALPPPAPAARHRVLLTCHRRETIGDGQARICTAVLRLADRGDVDILCPVHPNPAVAATVRAMLGGHPAIRLVDGLRYRDAVAAMRAARLILTDSGGIQEEAATLGIPVLVLRDTTERPEGVATGNLLVVGTDPARIVAAASSILDDDRVHATMTARRHPYGTGDAAARTLDAIAGYFPDHPPSDLILPFGADRTKDGARQGA